MDPAPPPITIVDPNNPRGTADVLSSGPHRARWRPPSRLVRRASAVAVGLALVGGGLSWSISAYLDHRADAASVRDVRLAITDNHARVEITDTDGTDAFVMTTSIGLVTRGQHPVTLTRLDLVGGASTGVISEELTRSTGQVELPAGQTCSSAALTSTPTRMRLHLRTYRGVALVRDLPLRPVDVREYATAEQARCGYLPPYAALPVDVLASSVERGWFLVRYEVSNRSVEPLTITALASPPWLEARGPAWPLTVAPASVPPLRFTVRLRVKDCRAFRRTQDQPSDDPQLELEVRGRFASGPARAGLNSENDGILPTEVYAVEAFRTQCGLPTLD